MRRIFLSLSCVRHAAWSTSEGLFVMFQGHLAPDAAFIYDVQQDATYYFINVAPQFQVKSPEDMVIRSHCVCW